MPAHQTPFPDRETVAGKLSGLAEADQAFLKLLFENPQQDESLFEGLHLYLDRASEGRFLNSLKLERCGEWMGENATRAVAGSADRKRPARASTLPISPSATAWCVPAGSTAPIRSQRSDRSCGTVPITAMIGPSGKKRSLRPRSGMYALETVPSR